MGANFASQSPLQHDFSASMGPGSQAAGSFGSFGHSGLSGSFAGEQLRHILGKPRHSTWNVLTPKAKQARSVSGWKGSYCSAAILAGECTNKLTHICSCIHLHERFA